MKIKPSSDDFNEYLNEDKVIDFTNVSISLLANSLFEKAESEIDFIKAAYEFVRDNIAHSADVNEDVLTCNASEVLKAEHGICFAKAHLLAAILRYKSIPTGFCYQKLILDDEKAPILVYHGLNGVYIKELKKWIRLDARGNKNGVNAQFSVTDEQLAFPIRQEMGEEDGFIIYPTPDKKILEKLKNNKTRTELWDDLPTELGYFAPEELLKNVGKIHTTELGAKRIKRNLSLETTDVVEWCKSKLLSKEAVISRKGKNWYADVDGSIITINAYSYTIITAHKKEVK